MTWEIYLALGVASMPAVAAFAAGLLRPGRWPTLLGFLRFVVQGGVLASSGALAYVPGADTAMMVAMLGAMAGPVWAGPMFAGLLFTDRTLGAWLSATLGGLASVATLGALIAEGVAIASIENWLGGGNPESGRWLVVGVVLYLGALGLDLAAATSWAMDGLWSRWRSRG